MTHVIERLVIELAASEEGLARRAQAALGACPDATLGSRLDAFAARLAPDTVLRLDRLDVDLGALAADHFDEAFSVRLGARLEAALDDALERAERLPLAERALAVVPVRLDRLAVLDRYLATGTLPWHAAGQAAYDLDTEVSALLAEAPDALASQLARAIDLAAAERLALQLRPATADRLVGALAGTRAADCAAVQASWYAILTADAPRAAIGAASSRVGIAIRAAVIATIARSGDTHDLEAGVGERLAALLGLAGGGRTLAGACLGAAARIEASAPVRQWIERANRATSPASVDSADGRRRDAPLRPRARGHVAGRGSAAATTVPRPLESASLPCDGRVRTAPDTVARRDAGHASPGMRPSSARTLAPPHDAAADGALEVANAGLVLLWPLLGQLLVRVGLVAERRFLSEDAARRAVLLCQHLVDGGGDWPEHALVLNKLLCGLAIETPVPRTFVATAAEAREAADLLAAAIAHWTALGATSPQGLRAAFLWRDGRLAPLAAGWKLLVARAGRDVLLDRLPWGIGVVRLPWMPAPVYVEW